MIRDLYGGDRLQLSLPPTIQSTFVLWQGVQNRFEKVRILSEKCSSKSEGLVLRWGTDAQRNVIGAALF
jgi:hypothetical protein